MKKLHKHFLVVAIFTCSILIINKAFAQSPTDVNVLTYNLLNFPNTDNTDPLGNDASRATAFRQIVDDFDIDVILIQEMTEAIGASILTTELNNNGTTGKTFASTNYVGYGFPGAYLGNMLIYNTAKLNFIQKTELPPINTGTASDGTVQTAPRGISKYEFSVISNDCAIAEAPLIVYNMHLKGGDNNATSNKLADRDRRYLNIEDLYQDLTQISTTENIIVGGDLNLYSPNSTGSTAEPSYVELTNNSNAHYFTDALGFWVRNSSTYKNKYTQSTRTIQSFYGNGGVTGGMDDRFDFLFFNQSINNASNQIQYETGSYSTIGNSTVPLNANALAGSGIYSTLVHQISDHYPVKITLNVNFDAVVNCNSMNCPNVTSINNLPMLVTSGQIIEIEGLPAGGVFTTDGQNGTIVSNYFNPNNSGDGTFNVTYTFNDGLGCTTQTTQSVTVSKYLFNILDQCGQ